MAFDFEFREATCDDKRQCESILGALPEWFGIESAILQYAKDIQKMPTYVVAHNEQVCGFLSLKQHNAYTTEIQVMGLLRELHGQGLGTALVARAEAVCREKGIE